MIEIIFTSRPLSLKPISWVNAITRIKTRSPFDHVSLKYKGYIYESTAGKGVHKIHWSDWVIGREGSYLLCYEIEKRDAIKFIVFENLLGTKYDYWANIYYLFGAKKMLKRKSKDRMFCSELIASMMGYPNPHEFTPDDLERELRDYKSYITEL